MKRLAATAVTRVVALGLAAAALAACGTVGRPLPGVTGRVRSSSAPAAFTFARMTSAAGQAELLIRPTGPVRGLVVFMHGLDSDENQIVEDPQLERIGAVLVGSGYAIVASDAHGNNLGDPASVRDQQLAVADARHRLGPVRRVDVLGFSMGGLDALLTAASHRIAGLQALALLSPAVDQRAFVDGPFAPSVGPAFGNPRPSRFAAILRVSDPVLQPAAHYAGYRYHFWSSPADTVVPASQSLEMTHLLTSHGITAGVSPLTGGHGDLSALDPAAVLRLFAGDPT